MKLRRRIPPTKLQRAREFRRSPTAEEATVWSLLRNRRMLGLKFRRQHVIDGFIIDFYCAELQVVLEIDGGIHENLKQSEYDAARTTCLEARGLRVIRVGNDDVSEHTLRRLLHDLTP